MCAVTNTHARIWNVLPDGNGDAPTIQAAVDSAAVTGDGILINGGVYHEENIIVDGKDISITYFDGIPHLVDPTPGSGTCFILRNVSPGCSIFGLFFRGFGTAVSIEDGSPLVRYSTFKECGTGISISGSSAPECSNSLIDSCGTAVSILGGSGISIRSNTIVHGTAGVSTSGGAATVDRNIIYGFDTGVLCAGGAVTLDCNCLWNNMSDYSGCTPGTADILEDPIFCFNEQGSPGPYYLDSYSPCWSENNSCAVNMGAFTQDAGCVGLAVKESTWSNIKRMYR